MVAAILDRHPGSKAAFEKLKSYYLPLAEKPHDLLARRGAVLLLKEYADRYAKNCRLEDLKEAKSLQATLDNLAGDLMEEVRTLQRKELEEKVGELVRMVEEIDGKGIPSTELLEILGRLDNEIDKNLLQQRQDLQVRYNEASKKLVSLLNEEKGDVKVKDYNLRALNSANQALEIYNQGKSAVLPDNIPVQDIVFHLGGWDPRYLHPATTTYLTTVYAEIFHRLKPKDRLMMTEKMIRCEMRPLKRD